MKASARFLCVMTMLAFGLSACILPNGGPPAPVQSAEPVEFPHIVVPVTPEVVAHLRERTQTTDFSTLTGQAGPQEVLIGVGDIISITIFEAQAGGLFIPAEPGTRVGNLVTIPDQSVDKSGNISVPYAGVIHAAGRRTTDVQRAIEHQLSGRAIEPQVVLTVKEQRSAQISVLGNVNTPQRFPINPSGERVLDAIARAGGPKSDGFETYVTVQRSGRKASVYFNSLVREPKNNIYVRSGDIIYVYHEIRSFIAVGASGTNGRFNFETETLNLAEALGRAGGLLDDRAEPARVVVYRNENKEFLQQMGVDVQKWTASSIPTIYTLNLRVTSGIFGARDFPVADKDILYVADADAVDLVKFLNIVRSITGSAADTRSASQ